MNSTVYTLLNLIVLAAIIYGLYLMQKKHYSFTARVLTALGAGIILGGALQLIYGAGAPVIGSTNTWLGILSNGYVRLLNMIVIPLVFVAITTSIVNQESSALKKSAVSIIAVLLLTTAISAGIGAAVSGAFGLDSSKLTAGQAETDRAQALDKTLAEFQSKSIPEQITEIIPRNVFYAMTGQGSSATLSVVFFAAFLGIATVGIRKKKPESAEAFKKFLNMLHDVVMRMVTIVLRFTPYGVFALMVRFVATSNFSEITRLIQFSLANYVAILIMFAIHLVILSFYKLNPVTYLKKASIPLSFAFSSRSSAGTLPLNVETQTEKFGVSNGIANLSASLGTSIGQNGCAGIYPAMLAVMIATGTGVPMDVTFFVKLIVITAISSFGIAGVGGGATFAALTVLSSMGLPVGLVGLLIAIEPLIDMARTALNVSGSMVAGLVTSKRLGEINLETYNQDFSDLEEVSR
ncbi:cation:dicarboxylase symporter family transporter [Proteiniclasticum sp. BAD-10]|uniref:L-cystine uptake protein TcyP n=1 Tax=Proteiniclasticum sediminis TaxID=2804028 RepID=A0A941CPI4_9CLOT|nr:cation:dicarboxylase symporter family transporter [Proteiniclasticum sediminis]MBR0575028.1 cation:dicarboxylase symporter family transporter [Proteiniclasticum sediminis]